MTCKNSLVKKAKKKETLFFCALIITMCVQSGGCVLLQSCFMHVSIQHIRIQLFSMFLSSLYQICCYLRCPVKRLYPSQKIPGRRGALAGLYGTSIVRIHLWPDGFASMNMRFSTVTPQKSNKNRRRKTEVLSVKSDRCARVLLYISYAFPFLFNICITEWEIFREKKKTKMIISH